MNEIIHMLSMYDINKLDINRMNRYIEKYIKENAPGIVDKEIEEDTIEEETEIEESFLC